MAFEVIASNKQIHQLLLDSLNRIEPYIDPSLHNGFSILITDIENIHSIFPNGSPSNYEIYKKYIADSFGIAIGNIVYNCIRKHLVIISIPNIVSLNINDEEFDGILSHELGHIFNEPPFFEDKRSFIKGQQLLGRITENEYLEKIKIADLEFSKYQDAKEFYADHFSKQVNCKEGLLSSIHKYLSQPTATNKEIFYQRIEKLNSEEKFSGEVKSILSLKFTDYK